jgi:hypothetical protein
MLKQYLMSLWQTVSTQWPRFWFAPTTGETLALIRIATGLLLAYVHFIWLIGADEFFGPNALINRQTNSLLHQQDTAWTYLRYFDSVFAIRVHESIAIAISLLLASGYWFRVAAPLAWFLALMVCHRATGHLFGLDQTIMMLAFGLMIASLGSQPNQVSLQPTAASSMNTFATRLIQLQLCAMYLFGGLGKMRGSMWWDGSAPWFSAASYEYQSLDMTWVGYFPLLASVIAHLTIFWETSYCILVWPKLTRPIVLGIAILVHLSIALFLGMITFGIVMIIANLIFVKPHLIRLIANRFWTTIPARRASEGPGPLESVYEAIQLGKRTSREGAMLAKKTECNFAS